jgi:hypothetical protein
VGKFNVPEMRRQGNLRFSGQTVNVRPGGREGISGLWCIFKGPESQWVSKIFFEFIKFCAKFALELS